MHSLGDISHHYGVTVTQAFISGTLGIEHDEKEKRSSKYSDEKVHAIGLALSTYMGERAEDSVGKKPKAEPKQAELEKVVKSFDEEEDDL